MERLLLWASGYLECSIIIAFSADFTDCYSSGDYFEEKSFGYLFLEEPWFPALPV